MPFSELPRSYEDTAKRTSNEYVRFTPEYRTVLRILDDNARTVWKHWLPQANGGRGMGIVCANTAPGLNICPVEKSVADLPREDEARKAVSARRKFVVNVLDRTPFTTCASCNTPTPGKIKPSTTGKFCVNCDASLTGLDFEPLNKVKILEQGPRLFNEQLNAIEQMQLEEINKPITEYDITFTTQGQGRDRNITVIPQDPKPLTDADFLDSETGEPQALYDLELLSEPPSTEDIELYLTGATVAQVNALHGIE